MALRTLADALNTTSTSAKVGVKHKRPAEESSRKSPRAEMSSDKPSRKVRELESDKPSRRSRDEVASDKPSRKVRPVQVEGNDLPVKPRTPRASNNDNADFVELSRAQRKALGLARGEQLTKLTRSQRQILEDLDAEVNAPRTPRTPRDSGNDKPEYVELSRAQRKALGLARGEQLTKLTRDQRKILSDLETESAPAPRTPRDSGNGNEVRELKQQVRDLERQLMVANRKLDKVRTFSANL